VALQVGIVGLPGAPTAALFKALTRTTGAGGKENVGMAPIADERLDKVAAVVKAKKVTPATIRVVDVPGTGAALLGNLRQMDALLAVPAGADDLENLELELLVADRDHVEKRLERVAKQAKSGEAKLRAEVGELERILAHLDEGGRLRDYDGALPGELDPLTTKPLLVVEGIDLALEAELVDLPDEEAAQFRDGESALAGIVRRLFESLDLLSFFTAGEKETRAWTLRRGQTALEAGATIHTDIARGFIRCEVIRWDDLVDSGSHAEARKRGVERLEGKSYEVQDGDVLNIRFNV
jgi:ribosome-binding ATPase YchF (GTP1/OBG family)